MRKLLNKSLVYYLIFGLLFMLVTIPAFYIYCERHYTHEIDEYLLAQRDNIYEKSLKELNREEISLWNNFNEDKTILPLQNNGNIFVTEDIYDANEKEHEPYRVLYSIVSIDGDDYTLMLRLSFLDAKKIIQSATVMQLILFISLMVCFVIITQVFYRRLWRPFYKTIAQIEAFNIHKSEVPAFLPTTTLEFAQLNDSLTALMQNNISAYKTQKEFTENASHEMQTPLSIFRSKLDLLLQQPELTEEQLSIIESLYQTSGRLARLNKNLLLMAKIDNSQFVEAETVDVGAIIGDSLAFMREQAQTGNITIQTDMTSAVCVCANRSLTECLVNNLISNAIKHNIESGSIYISLKDNVMTICNTGVAKPLIEASLFKRFSRVGDKTKGSGLGLAIVRQICDRYGWTVSYAYLCDRHQFVVGFRQTIYRA